MELIQFGADVNYRAKTTRACATTSTMQTKLCTCVGTCQCLFGTMPLFQGMSTGNRNGKQGMIMGSELYKYTKIFYNLTKKGWEAEMIHHFAKISA